MADLNGLIKLRRHGIDERQKALGVLLRQAETLELKKQELRDTLEQERKIAEESATKDYAAYFGAYADGVQKTIGRIDADLKKIEVRIQIAQDDIRNAFAELKKIEIVQQEREKEDKKKQDAKESAELDEIAIDGFIRREENA